MNIQPYILLGGQTEAAIAFYQATLGAKVVMMMRFSDAPDQGMITKENKNLIMHASIQIGESMLLMSDGNCDNPEPIKSCSLSLNIPNLAEAEATFHKLAEGGTVTLAFGKTFWSEGFGMLVDRFGVAWMVSVFHG